MCFCTISLCLAVTQRVIYVKPKVQINLLVGVRSQHESQLPEQPIPPICETV